MKQYLLLAILLELSKKPIVTAKFIAEKFEISTRSVYRYILSLESAGIQTFTKVGKNGGVGIENSFAFESFLLTKKEKDTINLGLSKLIFNKEVEAIKSKLNL